MFNHHNNHYDYALLQRLYQDPVIEKSQEKRSLIDNVIVLEHLSSVVVAATLILMT